MPETPGAPESNAGDDFHVVWAARRALRLIDPHEKTSRVVVEGIGPIDDPEGDDSFLVADLTEYEEGKCFLEASQVVVSQLKYSTRHPDRNWTVGRLSRGKTQSGESTSIISRMGDALQEFRDRHGREKVINRLVISLVSNRPLGSKLENAIRSAKEILERTGLKATHYLLQRLDEEVEGQIERLYEESGLQSYAFTDLLRVIDLESTAVENRGLQRVRLVQEFFRTLSLDPVRGLRGLQGLIRKEALPEGASSVGLDTQDVFAAMGISGQDDLFPARSKFNLPSNPIPVGEAAKLEKKLSKIKGDRLIAHGVAGIGKTTTVHQLSDHLSPESEVIMYDCFGDGDYLTPGAARHTLHRALRQIANQIALRCGTPFLLSRDLNRQDLIRRFRKTLDRAGKLISEDGGELVLVIDAADNSIVAARKEGDRSFLSDLLEIPLPDNVSLIATCRSHRIDHLDDSDRISRLKLEGFSSEESATHLRRWYPEATESEVEKFHRRTEGNPRVQFYLLENSDTLQTAVEVADKRPEDIFESIFKDIYSSAVEETKTPEEAEFRAALLLEMTRPAPVRHFARILGVSHDRALQYCKALEPGLVLESGKDERTVGFRDEDFESYLRERLSSDVLLNANDSLADYHLQHATESAYSARSVGEHLFRSGRSDELVNLALNDSKTDSIKDPLVRLNTLRRRVTLALRTVVDETEKSAAVKLLFAAAEYSRSDEATVQLIHEAPGLAVRFGDAESIAEVYVRKTEESWLGPAHFHAAAALARNGEHESAREHGRAAHAWLRKRKTLDPERRRKWELKADDISSEIEALYWLRGPKEAYDRFKRWHPRERREEIATTVTSKIAPLIGADKLTKEVKALDLHPIEAATVLAAAWEEGIEANEQLVQNVAAGLLPLSESNRNHRADSWAVPFAELASRKGCERNTIQELLSTFGPGPPERLAVHSRLEGIAPYLRSTALLATFEGTSPTAEELIPNRLKKNEGEDENGKPKDSERERWNDVVGAALPAFLLRAKSILGDVDACEIANADLFETHTSWSKSWNDDPFAFYRYEIRVNALLDALILAKGEDQEAARDLLVGLRGASSVEKTAFAQVRRARSLVDTSYRDVAFDVIDRAVESLLDEELPARNKWELLLNAAHSVEAYDADWAQELYDTALEKASELDDEGAYLLGSLGRVLKHHSISSSSPPKIAARLARAVEAQEPYVSDRDHLPIFETVEAATAADLTMGLALSSRWNDEDRIDIGRGTTAVVRAAAEAKNLKPERALSLLRFSEGSIEARKEVTPHLKRLLNRGPGSRPRLANLVKNLSNWIQKDVPISGRPSTAREVVNWSEAQDLDDLGGLSELREIVQFFDDIKSDQSTTQVENSESFLSDSRIQERKEREAQMRSAVEHAVQDAKEGDFSDLLGYLETVGTRMVEDHSTLLESVRSVTSRRHRTDYLKALHNIAKTKEDVPPILTNQLLESFSLAANEWKQDTAVQSWMAEEAKTFIEEIWPSLSSNSYHLADRLRKILDLPLNSLDPAEVILQLIARRVESVGTLGLLAVAEALADDLPPQKRIDVIDSVLTSRESQIGDDHSVHVPDKATVPTAKYLWCALGHPDCRIRWRALHSAHAIVSLDQNRETFLSSLAELAESKEAGEFRTPSRLFYWQSARAGVMQLFLRLVHEDPEWVTPYSEFLARHALSKDLPHAQIRELARRSALALSEKREGVYTSTKINQLSDSNRPSDRIEVDRDHAPKPYDRFQNEYRKTVRFDFDFLDTVPYWYSDLERRLDVEPGEVLERADNWICDAWGLPDADWRNDPRRPNGYDRDRKARVYKGDYPTVMTRRTHLTYHAMMCVAGELLDEGAPLVKNPRGYLETSDVWKEWLQPHLPARDDSWHHDHLSPTPLESKFWGEFPEVNDWRYSVTLADYDHALGLSHTPDGGIEGEDIVVRAEYGAYGRHDEDILVKSALVTPRTSEALLRAYQSVPDHREHAFPPGPYSDDDFQREEFELVDWINVQGPNKALDDADPLIFDLGLGLPELHPEVIEVLDLKGGPGSWTSSVCSEKPALHFEKWSDDPGGRQQKHRSYSQGYRIWFPIEALLHYLRQEDYNLLIEVVAKRHERDRYDRDSREYDPGHAIYYLLRRDGTIRAMERDRSLRPKDSS